MRVYNAKRTRLIKKNPELAEVLPPKLNAKELRESIGTRADFNYQLRWIEKFNKEKNSTNPVLVDDFDKKKVVTKWERDKAKADLRRANNRRAKIRKERGIDDNEGFDKVVGVIDYGVSHENFPDGKNKKANWDAFRERVWKMSFDKFDEDRDTRYRENYMKAARNVYGDTEFAGDLEKLINQLSAETLIRGLWADGTLEINFVYEDEDVDNDGTGFSYGLLRILERWYAFLDMNNIPYTPV